MGPSARAQDTGTVVGEGARTCGKFLKAGRREQNNYIVWVQGYFTAYNAIAPDIQNVLGNHDYHWVLSQLKTLCKQDRDQYFNEAVVSLTKQLHPRGIRLEDPGQETPIQIQTK